MPIARVTQSASRQELCAQSVALVLAGGNGTRLGELTRWDAKPAVPFGGIYRNIDFSLSNCINSGLRRIAVLTQYKAQSLIEHLNEGWNFLPRQLNEFIDVWPAQQRVNNGWYRGTADAIHQNIDMLQRLAPKYVVVLAGDHIYSMDYAAMIESHVASGAEVTIGCLEMPRSQVSEFGVVTADERGRILNFIEKPRHPERVFPDREQLMVSMGIYIFSTDYLIDVLQRDAALSESAHDFGKDVLPRAAAEQRANAYLFRDRRTDASGYWRDVGTVDAYWQTHMELLADEMPLSLADPEWPIYTRQQHLPPARIIQRSQRGGSLVGNVIVSPGCVVTDAVISNSVLSPGVTICSGAIVEDCVILPGAVIGPRCHITRAVIDAGIEIPAHTVIGRDRMHDDARFAVTSGHISLVSRSANFASLSDNKAKISCGAAA